VSLVDIIRKRSWNSATAITAISATQPAGKAVTVARIATVAVARLLEVESDELVDSAVEVRRQRVLTMLADNPELRLAVVCDGDGDPCR